MRVLADLEVGDGALRVGPAVDEEADALGAATRRRPGQHLVHTAAGPAWRNQRFRLLYLHPSGSEGIEHLRASEQAINIFVEALDLDIEAAQIANEAQLNALIARGAIESAVQIAKHARYRSIQYQERIRRIVADTLIDPDVHD